jgi:hypothetical protein
MIFCKINEQKKRGYGTLQQFLTHLNDEKHYLFELDNINFLRYMLLRLYEIQ